MELNQQAVEVRELISQLEPLLTAGDPGWRPLHERARAIAASIDDPYSADDAISRLASITQHERLLLGDIDGARQSLLDGVAAVKRQQLRDQSPEQQPRLADHLWVLYLNLAQLEQWAGMQTGQWEPAAAAAAACLEVAPHTLEPAARMRQSQVTVAAMDMAMGRLPEALAGYRLAVDAFRVEEPEALGVVLLGLAQAQLQLGSFDDATATLNRAEPLLTHDADAQAALLQARGYIATMTRSPEAAEQLRAYAAAGANPELNPLHQAQARQSFAHAEHADGEIAEAKRQLDALVASARAAGEPLTLANALARASTATQDLALITAEPAEALALHHAALAQLSEAHDLHPGSPLDQASLEVSMSDYVLQWHLTVDAMTLPLLRSALDRADGATAVLRAAALTADTARERRDFAQLHAAHGFEVACALAFRLGDKDTLARLITDRAAHYDWRASRDSSAQAVERPA